MLRAKAYQFNAGTMKHPVRDRLLSSTDRNGKLATIPVVVQMVNAAAKSKPLRAIGEKIAGVHKDAWLPEFAPRTFRPNAAKSAPHPVRDGERTPGKVAIFSTCYVNYNEPGIGHDLAEDPRPQRDPATCSSRRRPAAACPSSSRATSSP